MELGALTDHEEIGELVERAWEVRKGKFGDSTDMCSLVNAKSGGCAEDCGFCAQSRYAEADTPMHAMMDPEQILEHAKAAEAAGAHRFCMVTQGQGLSKRDFAKILEGAKLVAEQTNLKRCASVGHISPDRAAQLAEAGIQRVHHNVETARSYYEEVTTTVKYEGRMRTIDAVRQAGLETCVGGILNLGESPRQRVEMAFELSEINPTSVPINLLNPRTGTKFGDRELLAHSAQARGLHIDLIDVRADALPDVDVGRSRSPPASPVRGGVARVTARRAPCTGSRHAGARKGAETNEGARGRPRIVVRRRSGDPRQSASGHGRKL